MRHVYWQDLTTKARRLVKAYYALKDMISARIVAYRKHGADHILLVDDWFRFKREHWQEIDAEMYRIVDKEKE